MVEILWFPEPGGPKAYALPRTAICGTDVHIYDWNEWAMRTIPTPMVVGHEYCGIIKELGPELSKKCPLLYDVLISGLVTEALK